jgi:hypothetical protein
MERSAWASIWSLIAAAVVVLGACASTAPDASSTGLPSVASSPTSSSRPTATEAARQTVPVALSGEPLAEAPGGCPGPEPRSQAVADFVGPVAGGPPLWAGIYASYDAAGNAYSAADAPLTEYGWRIKILYLLEPAHEGAVQLVGAGVDGTTGTVTFAVGGISPSTVAMFDPEAPAIPVTHEGWREYPSYAYFPSAGCYLLTATWTGGSSELGFGFGR